MNRPPYGVVGNAGFDAGAAAAKPVNNDVAGVGDGAPGNRPPVAGGPNREPPAAGAVACGGAKGEGPGPKSPPPGGALVVGAGDGEVLGPNVAADWLRASPPLLAGVAVFGPKRPPEAVDAPGPPPAAGGPKRPGFGPAVGPAPAAAVPGFPAAGPNRPPPAVGAEGAGPNMAG